MTKSRKWQGWAGVFLVSVLVGGGYAEMQDWDLWAYPLSVFFFGVFVLHMVVFPWYSYGLVKGALGVPDQDIIDAERTHAAKAATRTRRRLERLERNG